MARIVEECVRVLVQTAREVVQHFREAPRIEIAFEPHLECEILELGRYRSDIFRRVAKPCGVGIGAIGNQQGHALGRERIDGRQC